MYENWFSVPSLKLAFGKFAEQKGRFLGERDGYSFYRFEGVAAVPQGERERPPKGEYPEGAPSGRFFGDFLIGEKVTRGLGVEHPN